MATLIKICAFGIISVILAGIVKQYRPEFVVPISVCTSIIMLSLIIGSLKEGFSFIYEMFSGISSGEEYIAVILKVLGIAYITEFAASLCSDAGEKSTADKVELAGKIAVFFAAMPVFTSLIELFNNLM